MPQRSRGIDLEYELHGMREEKGKRRKEKENDIEERSRRWRKGRRKGRRYASGFKPPKPKMLATSLIWGEL